MKSVKSQYSVYIKFAVISIIINTSTQIIVQTVYNHIDWMLLDREIFHNVTYGFMFKILIATGVAFIFKYIIDKAIVFEVNGVLDSKRMKLRQFGFYLLFSFVTTIIFWGIVLVFKMIFADQWAELVGTVVGLSIGYTIKFFLDCKIAFKPAIENKEEES